MDYICDIPRKFCAVRSHDNICKWSLSCFPIIDKCFGCDRIENNYCKLYINPSVKWLSEGCPGATHIEKEIKGTFRRAGQQKQKKRK